MTGILIWTSFCKNNHSDEHSNSEFPKKTQFFVSSFHFFHKILGSWVDRILIFMKFLRLFYKWHDLHKEASHEYLLQIMCQKTEKIQKYFTFIYILVASALAFCFCLHSRVEVALTNSKIKRTLCLLFSVLWKTTKKYCWNFLCDIFREILSEK